MDVLVVAAQVFLAIAMFDVWLFRYNRPLRARGGDAKTMAEEFKLYGLPDWMLPTVRVLKLGSGVLMLVGIAYPPAAFAAGVTLIVLMGGAITMHFKIRDPLYKAVPATFFFALSAYVTYAHRAFLSG